MMKVQNPFSFVAVKFGACFVFLALVYRLFSSNFPQFSTTDTLQPSSVSSPNGLFVTDKCDLFKGEWIRDANGGAGPYYTNSTCFSIEGHQNCMKNGRPDTEYLSWRWNPTDCDLPKFDAFKFLRFLSGKSMAFIGDSIMRNHAQSLVCTLSQVPYHPLCFFFSNFSLFGTYQFWIERGTDEKACYFALQCQCRMKFLH